MAVTLEIVGGLAAGRSVVVEAGRAVKVGRTDAADVVVAGDPLISNLHFALEADAEGGRLRDLGSRFGTEVNRVKVTEARLRDGDEIVAGQTRFVVRLREEVPSPPPAPPGPAAPPPAAAPAGPSVAGGHARVVEALRRQSEPLFALLDAARDPRVLELLRASRAESQSLYEGPEGEALARYAPYLVRMAGAGAGLLGELVGEGWGKAWGVYLTSRAPFAEVRRHFRRFLLVKAAGGKELYFRFYDPRVLRVFLPECDPDETRAFFGPVTAYLLEAGPSGEPLRFREAGGRAEREVMPV
jgi:Domain of unknown function (DUF4123)/Inner membrane component of T3SS, cytoplasmic domain